MITSYDDFMINGEMGDTPVEIINAVSSGVQGTIKGYADAKADAVSSVVLKVALGGVLVVLALNLAFGKGR